MAVADPFVNQAMACIDMIRSIHKSNLDIILVYNGNELSSENIKLMIDSFSRVFAVNLAKILSIRSAHLVKKFSMKPFSILAAIEYDEVILIDADVFFFQKPDVLFTNRQYLETGALFFRDRAIIDPKSSGARLDEIVRAAATLVFDGNRETDQDDGLDNYSRLVNQDFPEFFKEKKTMHIMESGVVVMNKRKNLLELLTVCLLNQGGNQLHDTISRHFYGDKELFWIGFELANYRVARNYFMAPLEWTGSIGVATPNPHLKSVSLCSAQIVHALSQGSSLDLMWMNGGLVQNKYSSTSTTIKPADTFRDWMIPQLPIHGHKIANTSWFFQKDYLACLECSLSVYVGLDKNTELPISCNRPIRDDTRFLLERGMDISRRYLRGNLTK